MRLLYLNHNVAQRGGTFYRAYHIARYMVQRGHTVTLLTISAHRRWGIDREMSEGVEIIHTPDLLWGIGRSGWDPWDTLNRLVLLRGQHWDIIHAWDSRPAVILPALYARAQSRAVGGKLITDWCDWFGRGGTQVERPGRFKWLYSPVETFFEEAFRAQADGTTIISQALYQRALGLGVKADTMRLLPQGCDIENTRFENRGVARQRLGIMAGQSVILCVGALLSADAEQLFDTLRLVFRQRPDCLAVMVGKHGAQIPPDLADAPQLQIAGFVPENALLDYTAACDALLVPMANTLASQARWPSRVNPFLTAGRAVVMPRIGDLAQLLEQRAAAVVVEGQPEAMASGVLKLLADPALQKQCEDRAWEVARDVLAWPLLIGRLEDLYWQVKNSTETAV